MNNDTVANLMRTTPKLELAQRVLELERRQHVLEEENEIVCINADPTAPEITGIYVHDHGESENVRYEVRFHFSGEVCFETPEIAAAAVAEYEEMLRMDMADRDQPPPSEGTRT